MVYSFVRRESPETLLRVKVSDDANTITHLRHKSDSLLDFSQVRIPAVYEDKHLRNKSPSRKQTRENRANSCDRKGTLVKRKSTKEKENLTKGNIFVSVSDSTNYSNKDKKSICNEMVLTCIDNSTDKVDNCECEQSRKKNKPKSKKISKTNALFDAVLDNDFTLLRKLIITDEFDVDEVNLEGNTGLHFAAAAGHLECMQLLLDCGSRVNLVDDYLRTPLEYAVLYGNFDCASLLIENGADTSLIKDGIL